MYFPDGEKLLACVVSGAKVISGGNSYIELGYRYGCRLTHSTAAIVSASMVASCVLVLHQDFAREILACIYWVDCVSCTRLYPSPIVKYF